MTTMTGYFLQGIQHITDFDGYDHMLFLVALAAPFTFREWKPLVLMATAFTVGHSLSLLLAVTGWVRFSSNLIEMLIPVTIILTSINNLRQKVGINLKTGWMVYSITLFFGLIHGLGFSSYFRMICDDNSTLAGNLFLFNLGVEAGQLIIIGIYLLLAFVILIPGMVKQRHLTVFLSLATLFISAYLLFNKIYVG